MIMYQPYKKIEGNKVKLLADFEINGKRQTLWYEVNLEHEKYLVTEQCDGFIIILLIKAFEEKQDLTVHGKISSRLYYGLLNYIIPYLAFVFKMNNIKLEVTEINCSGLGTRNLNSTGMSCGVDSLSTYLNNNYIQKVNQISCFTYFNVGSHGIYNSNDTLKRFDKRYENVKKFAVKEDKAIIEISSNLDSILKSDFKSTHTFRAVSAVLIFQKLIGCYFYSSAFKFTQIHIKPNDPTLFDHFLLQGLSTETTIFYSSMSQYSREERIELISFFSDKINSYMDVCVSPKFYSNRLNCSTCYKCMITQIVLELNGKLDKYEKSFDLEAFHKGRNKFIGKIILHKKNNLWFKNLYKYIMKNDAKYIRLYHFLLSFKLAIYSLKKRLKFL